VSKPPDLRARSGGRAPAGVSLARALSKLGFCSRAQGVELVRAGRVRVNGAVHTDPDMRVSPERDRITVDGALVAAQERVYLALNKPRGLVTTTADERGRDTVYACLTDPALPRVVPVGRLDRASEGLLLLTNDTRWADRITDPATHLDKTYHVQVDRVADADLLRRMMAGVEDGGEHLAAKRAHLLRSGGRNSWIEVVLDEGRNRHVRRLIAALGAQVLRLVRVSIGPLTLGDLPKGAVRPLTSAEKDAVDAAMAGAGRARSHRADGRP
jgi:23S rRNA pseudouridine2605 synthase